jgi:glycosyltransferase involved in cell wall biosynthesis
VLHKEYEGLYWAYGPYIREMNIWAKNTTTLMVLAPKINSTPSLIDLSYKSAPINFREVPPIALTSIRSCFHTIIQLPFIIITLFQAMREADHIHLRCPGNMGLLGCLVQILFPKKPKTAKYAGNWDWNSKQAWSYRMQQWILRNTFLTRNMTALVYGDWPDRTWNIKPFFTASYSIQDALDTQKPNIDEGINLIFVGSLTSNKRPLLALQVLTTLLNKGYHTRLVFYGDGPERSNLQRFAAEGQISEKVEFRGNVSAAEVKLGFQHAHFLVFGSKSEGWPKAVAEAMWWGCIPVTTAVSCVPQMLDEGHRGLLCKPNAIEMATKIIQLVEANQRMYEVAQSAIKWSREYTLERLEKEISKLLAH